MLYAVWGLSFPGCDKGGEEELVQASEIVGTWEYQHPDARDRTVYKMAFHRTGRFEQKRGGEMLLGTWRLEESNLVVEPRWTRLASGEQLDLELTTIHSRYRVRMRGNTLLVDPENSKTQLVFNKITHTSLLQEEDLPNEMKEADKGKEQKSGH